MKLTIALIIALSCPLAFADLPYLGGKTTTRQSGTAAFSQPAPNLPLMEKVDFSVGNSFFRNPWVIAPSSTTARDGLGPLFNTNGCQNCHIRDGRGHAPLDNNDNAVSMLIRLSIKPETALDIKTQQTYGPLAEPTYGGQLQDFAIPGAVAEGRIETQWHSKTFTYPDGSNTELKWPVFKIKQLGYGDFHPSTQFSARIAPQMIGLGLLEQIPEQQILAHADEHDRDGNGISGRPNFVWNTRQQTTTLGRFGWKAGMPSLKQQNAGAFNGDIGITSKLAPKDDCTANQITCKQLPNGESGTEKELQDDVLAAVTFYTRHLAVPIQKESQSKSVLNGLQLFQESGCADCHVMSFTTPKLPHLLALSEQTFHPFTDLLLHDMGPELADNREEFLANGQEWRTPPLWGIGYLAEVNDQQSLMHDGRATTVEQAILWHAGEAENSLSHFIQLPKEDRQDLINFVNSL